MRVHAFAINEWDENFSRQQTAFCGIKPVHYCTNLPDHTVSHSRRSSNSTSAFLHWHVTLPQIIFIWRCFLNSICDTDRNVTAVVAYLKIPEQALSNTTVTVLWMDPKNVQLSVSCSLATRYAIMYRHTVRNVPPLLILYPVHFC
jgi:hypothetical protein